MKKLGRPSILDVLKRAKSAFIYDPDAEYAVKFVYRDHIAIAFVDPVPDRSGWVVWRFQIIYSRCVMDYFLGTDFDETDAFFDG